MLFNIKNGFMCSWVEDQVLRMWILIVYTVEYSVSVVNEQNSEHRKHSVGISRVLLRGISASEQYQVGGLPFPTITIVAHVIVLRVLLSTRGKPWILFLKNVHGHMLSRTALRSKLPPSSWVQLWPLWLKMVAAEFIDCWPSLTEGGPCDYQLFLPAS